jgi:hypothetical protein
MTTIVLLEKIRREIIKIKGAIWNRRLKLFLAKLYIQFGGKNEFSFLFNLDIDGLVGLNQKELDLYLNQISRLRELIHIKTL